MKKALLLFGVLAACAPKIEITLSSLADASNPRATLEFTFTAGDQTGTISIPDEPLPVAESLTLPESFELLPLHLEVRALVGAREIARGSVDIAPGQQEAAIRFAVCSNGAPELSEACEDGNLTDGDGCDSTCKPTGCSSGVATPGELCFLENDNLLGPVSPLQVLTADLNGDQLPDLAAPYLEDGAVRVFNNQGAGLFGGFDEIPVPGVERLTLADLDEDGDLDLVASVHRLNFAPELVLLSNDGGSFTPGTPTTLSALDVSALALGDLNGDGLLDLVFTDKNTSLLKVNLGEEGAGFGSQAQALSVGFQPVALALEDTDLDGDLDAISASASGSVSFLENQNGTLLETRKLLSGVPSALVIGDFTGDSLPDLAVATQDGLEGKIVVFENRGIEGFRLFAPFPATESPSALEAADVDLDGDLDLIATSKTRSLIEVQFNKFGQFDPPRDASGGLFDTRLGPVSLAVSDLNGDGVPDLVAAGENLGVLLSNP